MEPWWPQSAWLSSGTAMFLVFNILIVTVAVLSRGEQGGHGRRLCRSASSMVLGRLRSFSSMFSVYAEAECYDHHTTAEAGELQVGVVAPGQQRTEPTAADTPSALAAVAATDAVPFMEESKTDEAEEAKCTRLNSKRSVQDQLHHAPGEASPPVSSAVETAVKEEPAKEAPEASCKRRARSCWREAEESLEGKAELNARAELFIHQFKEDLKLQRLNSIINYTRALRRRAGAALQLPQE